MRRSTLGILAGLETVLVPTGAVSGDYTGLSATVEYADSCDWVQDRGTILMVFRVYANYDDPNDRAVAVAGTPDGPMDIHAYNVEGQQLLFFQHPIGGDLPPNSAWFEIFPSLAYDTFVTIGALADDTGTEFVAGWPGIGPFSITGDSIGWFLVPGSPQGLPDEQGRVVLGQFTMAGLELDFGYYFGGLSFNALLQSQLAGGMVVQPYEQEQFSSPFAVVDCNWNDVLDACDLADGLLLDCDEDGVPDLCTFYESCYTDFDCSGEVGVTDLLALLAAWGDGYSIYDVEHADPDWTGWPADGVVDQHDLLRVLASWGPCDAP